MVSSDDLIIKVSIQLWYDIEIESNFWRFRFLTQHYWNANEQKINKCDNMATSKVEYKKWSLVHEYFDCGTDADVTFAKCNVIFCTALQHLTRFQLT